MAVYSTPYDNPTGNATVREVSIAVGSYPLRIVATDHTNHETGTAVFRHTFERANGGTPSTTQLNSKRNTRSASPSYTSNIWTNGNEPNIIGLSLYAIGYQGSGCVTKKRITPPSHRYPLIMDHSGSFSWRTTDTSEDVTGCITVSEGERDTLQRKFYGRRGRNRGGFTIRNGHSGLWRRDLATAVTIPGRHNCSEEINYTQTQDWPVSLYDSGIFLNLLNGNADVSLDAGDAIVTLSAPSVSISASNSDLSASNNIVTITNPTATISTGGANQNISAGDALVTLSNPTVNLTIGNSNVSAGNQVFTVTAPVATLVALIDLLAGTNAVTLTNPAVSVSSGAISVNAGGNIITITNPIATIDSGAGTGSDFWCGNTGNSGNSSGGDIEELD